ncbi:MAG: HAMP domain-containing sensor histidine kinase [Sulfurimonadaceae bacterium]|jgi:signal transduction histidine kinase|nr:HAMP domain-containing sensor histidine kinase [Sulfurimonadaceae bacterium]
MLSKIQEKIVAKILTYSPTTVVVMSMVIATFLSVPSVYLLSIIFDQSYTTFLFTLTIAMPLLITPVVVIVLLKMVKHLNYYKKYLEFEIEKSKEKDIVLFEQARFSIMGEMLANISHQWKQPLNTIGLAIVSLRTSSLSEDEYERYYDIMEDNISHLATTINDFSSFFDQKTHLEIRTIDSIIKEIHSILGIYLKNKNITLSVEEDNQLGTVQFASSISQVLLNLINNAKDAFENNQQNKSILLAFTTLSDGVIITCCDTGKGIDSEIQKKIYDPYFSTKTNKRGSGIGLYMSKQIIQKLFNGTLEIEKNSNYSTCFTIRLPFSHNCILQTKG